MAYKKCSSNEIFSKTEKEKNKRLVPARTSWGSGTNGFGFSFMAQNKSTENTLKYIFFLLKNIRKKFHACS